MAALFTIDEILTLEGAQLHGQLNQACLLEISTDSREIESKKNLCAYLALAGENFDGHNFVVKAFENGACLALVNHASLSSVLSLLPAACARSLPVVSVPDTLAAYQGLARLALSKQGAVVVAITGSSGKTTTKEMTAAALAKCKVHKSLANENNEIGVPKTILSMAEDTEVLILEMGMRGLGQIAELVACAQPDIGVITCAGTAHIELLGSKENIARAKCELFAALDPERGLAIIGDASDYLLAEAERVYSGKIENCSNLEIVSANTEGTTFKLPGIAQEFFVKAQGRVLVEDAGCAVLAARAAALRLKNLSDCDIAQGLAQFAAVEGRGNTLQCREGAVLIDESYNANPDSVRCAVESLLSKAFRQSDKIVILGEMAELGAFSQPLHEELGMWLKDKPLKLLITIGEVASGIASGAAGAAYDISAVVSQDEALSLVKSYLSTDSCIMVKGSHSTNLNKLVEKIIG